MRMRCSSVWQRTFIQTLTEKERNKQTNEQHKKKHRADSVGGAVSDTCTVQVLA